MFASELIRRFNHFAELFVIPDWKEVFETVDGCPVYRIPGSVTDFERFGMQYKMQCS